MTFHNCLIYTAHPSGSILIENNRPQEFDIILFNYASLDPDVLLKNWEDKGFIVKEVITKKTQCKGEIFKILADTELDYEYIAVWDHDIKTSTKDIHTMFELGQSHDWHWYQPSLTHDSHWSYAWTLKRSFPEYWIEDNDCVYTHAPFVEIMAPIFSRKLWNHLIKLFKNYEYISGYGLDNHLIPEALIYFSDLVFPVVVKTASVTHTEEITSHRKRYQNFLRAADEEALCKERKHTIVSDLYVDAHDSYVDIQCISLATSDSKDRKEQFEKSANKHNLEFEFFPAIDARQWSYSDYPSWVKHRGRRVDWYERLKPGEVGVAASHKVLFEEAWNNEIDALIVFEDDAVIVQSIDRLQVPKDADLLMLSNRWRHNRKGEAVGGSCGTEGYLITRKGIRKMLQIMQHVNMPLDLIMIAHCESMIEDGHPLTTVRNDLNPLLKIYHHHIFCIENDRGYSTVK